MCDERTAYVRIFSLKYAIFYLTCARFSVKWKMLLVWKSSCEAICSNEDQNGEIQSDLKRTLSTL